MLPSVQEVVTHSIKLFAIISKFASFHGFCIKYNMHKNTKCTEIVSKILFLNVVFALVKSPFFL